MDESGIWIKKFNMDSVVYNKRYSEALGDIKKFLGENKYNRLSAIFNNTLYKHSELKAYTKLLQGLGVRNPTMHDVSSLCKMITGEYNYMTFWELFKHHSERYKVFNDIYWVMQHIGISVEPHRYKLVIGKSVPKPVTIEDIRLDNDRRVVQSANYIFKIGNELGKRDSNYVDACSSLESGTGMCMYYTPQNILVLNKRMNLF